MIPFHYRAVAGEGIELLDLQVMGLASYHCSTPQCIQYNTRSLRIQLFLSAVVA